MSIICARLPQASSPVLSKAKCCEDCCFSPCHTSSINEWLLCCAPRAYENKWPQGWLSNSHRSIFILIWYIESNWLEFGTDNLFWHHVGMQKHFTNWLDGSPIIKGQNLINQASLASIRLFCQWNSVSLMIAVMDPAVFLLFLCVGLFTLWMVSFPQVRSGCAFMVHVCQDEHQLYNEFFSKPTPKLEWVSLVCFGELRPSSQCKQIWLVPQIWPRSVSVLESPIGPTWYIHTQAFAVRQWMHTNLLSSFYSWFRVVVLISATCFGPLDVSGVSALRSRVEIG